MSIGYRVIDLACQLNSNDHALLKNLNSRFDPRDIVVKTHDNYASIHLNAVDMHKLRHAIEEITATDNSSSSILKDVLTAVESIRSYGVRSGKRHFVGYADEFKSWVNAKWSIAPERNMKSYDHPAMFPEELAKRVLKLFSFSGSFVLDPFAGVGTTAVVAKKLQRRYLGIDISKDYCQTALTRLEAL